MPAREKTLVVASVPGRCVDFFSTKTWEKHATITGIAAQPHEIAYDPRRNRAYIAHYRRSGGYASPTEPAHEITVIDIDARAIHRVVDISPFIAPHDIEYDTDADLVYASIEPNSDGSNGLLILDPETWAVVDVIKTTAPNSHWCGVVPGRSKAYLTHKEAEIVSVIDLTTRTLAGTIPVRGGAEEVDCSPDGRWAYVVTPQNPVVSQLGAEPIVKRARAGTVMSHVLKIDTSSDEVVGDFEVPLFPSALRAGPEDLLLVSQGVIGDGVTAPAGPAPGRLWIVDAVTMTPVASIEVDRQPFTIRIASDRSFACVASVTSGTVNVVDLQKRQVTHTLENYPDANFGGSHGMCLAR